MPHRILFVASLHHPEALQAAVDKTPSGQTPPLFPPSMAQHFWEKSLRKRGHTLDVFWRNHSAFGGGDKKTERHTETITPAKLFKAVMNRIPPTVNPDIRERNRRLVDHAIRFQPTVLWMVGDNTVVLPDTVRQIKETSGCKVIYSCGTSPIVFSHPIDRAAASLYDLVIANDYYHGIQWLELGAKNMECLPISACDPDFHHPYSLTPQEQADYQCDVAFVGTLVPNHLYGRRVKALEALQDFDIGIWSVHEVPASLRKFVRGSALGEDMLKIMSASKICLNTHGDFMFYGGNLRLFEVAGAKVCQISDDLPGTRKWFPEVDGKPTLINYHSMDDLRTKVRYYLENEQERLALAEHAQAHVYQHHTYDVRAARLDELLEQIDNA